MDEEKSGIFNRKKILGWLKKSILPLTGLLIVVAVIVILSVVYIRDKDFFENLKGYGYAGVFVISVFLNATIIIPVSAMAIIASMGGVLPSPLLVGIIGGIGAGIGEMTAYIAGRSSRQLLAKNTIYTRVERWVKRWGWIAIVILSIFPFIFDFVGIIAGAMRMPWWKFCLACWAGRTISYVTVAYLAHFGFQALPWFN